MKAGAEGQLLLREATLLPQLSEASAEANPDVKLTCAASHLEKARAMNTIGLQTIRLIVGDVDGSTRGTHRLSRCSCGVGSCLRRVGVVLVCGWLSSRALR